MVKHRPGTKIYRKKARACYAGKGKSFRKGRCYKKRRAATAPRRRRRAAVKRTRRIGGSGPRGNNMACAKTYYQNNPGTSYAAAMNHCRAQQGKGPGSYRRTAIPASWKRGVNHVNPMTYRGTGDITGDLNMWGPGMAGTTPAAVMPTVNPATPSWALGL